MKTLRLFVAMTVLVIAGQYVMPLMGLKNQIIFNMFTNNCGALPVFFKSIMTPASPNNPEYLAGFLSCGAAFIGFLVLPGSLTLVVKMGKYVLHG